MDALVSDIASFPDSAWNSDWDLGESNHPSTTMSLSECYIAVKLADQPLAPKSILRLPESELGECPLGGCSISYLKQLITGKLQESIPDPEFIGKLVLRGFLRDPGGCPRLSLTALGKSDRPLRCMDLSSQNPPAAP